MEETADKLLQQVDSAESELSHLNEQFTAIPSRRCSQFLRESNRVLENQLADESNRYRESCEKLEASREAEAQVRGEYGAYQERVESQFEANAELIANLESELEARNSAIDLLERNADKLGAINDNVKKLDALIVDRVQASEISFARGEHPQSDAIDEWHA